MRHPSPAPGPGIVATSPTGCRVFTDFLNVSQPLRANLEGTRAVTLLRAGRRPCTLRPRALPAALRGIFLPAPAATLALADLPVAALRAARTLPALPRAVVAALAFFPFGTARPPLPFDKAPRPAALLRAPRLPGAPSRLAVRPFGFVPAPAWRPASARASASVTCGMGTIPSTERKTPFCL